MTRALSPVTDESKSDTVGSGYFDDRESNMAKPAARITLKPQPLMYDQNSKSLTAFSR